MLQRLFRFLNSIGAGELTDGKRKELSVELAGQILQLAKQNQSFSERLLEKQFARMMKDFEGKVVTTILADRCFRSARTQVIANQISNLFKEHPVPAYLPFYKRMGIVVLSAFCKIGHFFMVPIFLKVLKKEMSRVLVNEESRAFYRYVERCKTQRETVNLNHLGEAILGEEEANRRLEVYLKDLRDDKVEYISVKVSTVYSQINLLAFDETVAILKSRLRKLFEESQKFFFVDVKGRITKKFVNLDMEEYKDLRLTVAVFKELLSEPDLLKCRAGIVLQAYLPDSYEIARELALWAKKRLEQGGGVIKIRLVKGANLANEKIEASLMGWPQAPFSSKLHVDSNFKKILLLLTDDQYSDCLQVGVASHNLFDIAFAFVLKQERALGDKLQFEMLEGMANHIKRVVNLLAGGLVLYSPTASEKSFQNAVAYLIRRMDEVTGPGHFLRSFFGMTFGDAKWEIEKKNFLDSFDKIDSLDVGPRRYQDRIKGVDYEKTLVREKFYNAPDTDFSLAENQKWADQIFTEYKGKHWGLLPAWMGTQIEHGEVEKIGVDPSSQNEIYRYTWLGSDKLEEVFKLLNTGKDLFLSEPFSYILTVFKQIEHALEDRRGYFIGLLMADVGKPFDQADKEVSEAIDFVRYYLLQAQELDSLSKVEKKPLGGVFLASPWNFPLAISVGGLCAALMTRNAVIYKPAPESVLIGYELCRLFRDCGLKPEYLQLVNCEEQDVGSLLIQSEHINGVVLTGSSNTAKHFIKLKPSIQLFAETGGKNAIIATATCDRDLVIKSVIESAFGYSGQKCSACSLLILEAELYDDPLFLSQLKDAVASLSVGSIWDKRTKIGPLILPPSPNVLKGLSYLESKEEWLLQPVQDSDNPRLWSPGIKLNVCSESFSYSEEFFAPILSVMRAYNLEHAIELANGTCYGLTSGLQSLDENEQQIWLNKIDSGNLYINRGITGAIVRRQAFGGYKASSFGRGFKAGGPHYLQQFLRFKNIPQTSGDLDGYLPDNLSLLKNFGRELLTEKEFLNWKSQLLNYHKAYVHHFIEKRDLSQLLGQDNFLCYNKRKKVVFFQSDDSKEDLLLLLGVSVLLNVPINIWFLSQPLYLPDDWHEHELAKNFRIHMLTKDSFAFDETKEGVPCVRFLTDPATRLTSLLKEKNILYYTQPLVANGKLELANFLTEQSISIDYHRYGNLGFRERKQ